MLNKKLTVTFDGQTIGGYTKISGIVVGEAMGKGDVVLDLRIQKCGEIQETPINPKEKTYIEFSRYKQDCRKRALDLAVSEWKGLLDKTGTDAVIIEAEKYYNWLINIS